MKNLMFLAVLAAALLSSAGTALAGFQVTVTAGASSQTIVDNDGNDSDGAVGTIDFDFTVGGYQFRGVLSETNSSGTQALSFVDANLNRVSGTTATTVSIVASANGFLVPTGDVGATTGSTFGLQSGSNPASVKVSTYIDTTNTLAGATPGGTLVGSQTGNVSHSTDPSIDLDDYSTLSIGSSPYTLTLKLEATFASSGTNRIDMDGSFSVSALPVPPALALLASALPIAGFALWRRRKAKA